MSVLRYGALGLSLTLLLASVGILRAADPPAPTPQPPGDRAVRGFQGRLGGQTGPLLSDELKDKLKLTDDQKDKVSKLQKEFDDKSKDTAAKARDAITKAIQDQDPQAMQQIRDQMQAVRTLRGEYQDKVVALLTEDQKKTYDAARPARPARTGRSGRS